MTAPYPTEDDFRKTFALGRLWLTKPQKRLVRLLLCAPDHTMTATEMAVALGYDSYSTMNVQYGRLAQRVALQMGYSVSAEEPRSAAMIIFSREGPEEHWRWTMRPELVRALTSLGWKCPPAPPKHVI